MRKIIYLYIIFLLITLSGCVNGPEIFVDGVEEGKMYATKRTITIHQGKFGTYSMTLNGSPIDSGHVVSENGTYRLTITSKLLWMENEKELVFTIDDKPPNPPTFKSEIQPGYFQEAKLELLEDESVTYDVSLNGQPYDLREPIRDEGKYELEILAIKANGKAVQRNESFIIDNQTYNQEIVDTFLQFHFENEDNEDGVLIKWMNEIVPVYVHGNPTNEDIKQVQTVLNEFNTWLPVQFEVKESTEINSTGHQIDLFFVANEQFENYGFTGKLINGNEKIIGFTLPTEANTRDGLLTTTICVDTNVSQKVRTSTILHEFVHALGMYNHFKDDQTSILYPGYIEGNISLNETDRKIIEMLYRPDILPNMTKEEIQKMWEARIVE